VTRLGRFLQFFLCLISLQAGFPGTVAAELQPGQPVPRFSLNDIHGRLVEVNGLHGKQLLVLYFFDISSSSSRQGLEELDRLARPYRSELVVYGISSSPQKEISSYISKHNITIQVLQANSKVANDGMEQARTEKAEIDRLNKDNEEKRMRRKQINDNINSGAFFLDVLAELKKRARIADDIYLTSVSTQMPAVVTESADPKPGAQNNNTPPPAPGTAPDTFQVQRRVFIRGFAEGGESGKVVSKIKTFYKSLVPYEKEPDRPENLFKSIKDIWYGPDQMVGPNPVQEFVLEAYVELAKEEAVPVKAKGGGRRAAQQAPAGKSGPE